MRELVAQYLSKTISRRTFVNRLVKTGVTLGAARSVAESVKAVAFSQKDGAGAPSEGVQIFQGTGGEAFAEQLIASGVKYVFGNSSSGDAFFYEALVDRPRLKYILTPHEGPGAAMAIGYIQASGEPAIVMQAAIVGLTNAMGQMFNAWKEQTPLVFYSYRNESSRAAGRDAFEEVYYQEEVVAPLTKWHWLARRPDRIAETIRQAFKVAWTPPFGPTYATLHTDYLGEQVRTEVISHQKVDPRMRVRPDPQQVEKAAALLIEAKRPLMMVGDELYKTRSIDKAVEVAELFGMPVTEPRPVFSNFPQTHPLYVGGWALESQKPDLVINVGAKLQQWGNTPEVPRNLKFIDMRIDAASMGNSITLDVPLVADVAYGLEDLKAALEDRMSSSIQKRVQERTDRVRAFSQRARALRSVMTKSPEWNDSPMPSTRVSYEIARFADSDAIIVDEAGSVGGRHIFDFNPLGGREHFRYFAGHLGGATGRAAGVKLARPNRQVIALAGDGGIHLWPHWALEHGSPGIAGDCGGVQQPCLWGTPQPGDPDRTRGPHGGDRALRSRLSGKTGHEHGLHRQRVWSGG